MSMIQRVQSWWERISDREKVMVGLLGVAVPLTLLLWIGLQIKDGLAAREEKNDKMRSALRVLADLRARGPAAPPDTTISNIPADPVKLESYLDGKAKEAGVTVPRYNPGTSVTKNGFVTNSMRIELNDLTLEQLKQFLQAVEIGHRYVALTSLSLVRDYKDKDKVDARLEYSTYAKEPPPVADGSGSGSGSAGKGL